MMILQRPKAEETQAASAFQSVPEAGTLDGRHGVFSMARMAARMVARMASLANHFRRVTINM